MKITLGTICETALVDSQGRLSIIGIFENVNVAKLPTKVLRLTAVLFVEGKPGEEFDYYVSVENPEGIVIMDKKAEAGKARIGDNGKVNLITGIALLEVSEYGAHKLIAHAGKEKVALEFKVREKSN